MQKVELSIKRSSDNLYWNGTAFTSATELWLTATGTSAWSYLLARPAEARSNANDRFHARPGATLLYEEPGFRVVRL